MIDEWLPARRIEQAIAVEWSKPAGVSFAEIAVNIAKMFPNGLPLREPCGSRKRPHVHAPAPPGTHTHCWQCGEDLVVPPMCSSCQGSGTFLAADEAADPDDMSTETCQRCGGSGAEPGPDEELVYELFPWVVK